MRTIKQFIALIFLSAFFSLCQAQSTKEDNVQGIAYREAYESKKHVLMLTVLNVATKKFEVIAIELIDEQSKYFFAVDGIEYQIEYFRTGNKQQGCTGVFVAFEGELYQINSPFKRLKP